MMNLPTRWRQFWQVQRARLGRQHQCYHCRRRCARFLPYRQGWRSFSPEILATDFIGSDVENFTCPHCGCHDRERHLLMYFDRLQLWDALRHRTVLHLAPETALRQRIQACQPRHYLCADVVPSGQNTCALDLMHLPLLDESVDVVLCNHVLEHIPDDAQALREIARVLRPGGWAVLQTPYVARRTHTLEDPAIVTPTQREAAYGQHDHVRLYGQDLFARIAAAGLRLERHTHPQTLPDLEARYWGVNPREDLLLARRAPTS